MPDTRSTLEKRNSRRTGADRGRNVGTTKALPNFSFRAAESVELTTQQSEEGAKATGRDHKQKEIEQVAAIGLSQKTRRPDPREPWVGLPSLLSPVRWWWARYGAIIGLGIILIDLLLELRGHKYLPWIVDQGAAFDIAQMLIVIGIPAGIGFWIGSTRDSKQRRRM